MTISGFAIGRQSKGTFIDCEDESGELQTIDEQNIVHSWMPQSAYRSKIVTHAKGCRLWMVDGASYLDMNSQAFYVNIGHGDERVINAIADQAKELVTVHRYGNAPKLRLAKKLLSLLPPGFQRVFFGCNGSDAIEAALKIARMVTGKQEIISFHGEYHGASMGATSVTGIAAWRARIGQPVPGTIFVPAPYYYDGQIQLTQEEVESNALAHLVRTIELTGPATIAALIGEPIVTASLISFPSQGYWKKVRAICDDYGILLIADEVVTGFGRTGYWFACEHFDYTPDIICLAKGLSSGYLPMSAAIFSEEVSRRFDDDLLPHGLTYSGHPICCAAALANINVLEQDGLIPHAAEMGKHLYARLEALKSEFDIVRRADNLGLFAAIELDEHSGISPDTPSIGELVMAVCEEQGVLLRGAGNRVYLAPPLVVSEADLDIAMNALHTVLDTLARSPDASRT